jgi:membrane-bound lytic murein transglycosylase B
MLDDENIQRGDLSPSARGAWAGKVGPAEFLRPILKFAVDFDGNGRCDLIHGVPRRFGLDR